MEDFAKMDRNEAENSPCCSTESAAPGKEQAPADACCDAEENSVACCKPNASSGNNSASCCA